MPVGTRSTGAWALMLACRLDGLTEEQALQVAELYYNRCDHTDFDFKEIENWMNWTYNKKEAYWNKRMCDICGEIGVCMKDNCSYWAEVKEKMSENSPKNTSIKTKNITKKTIKTSYIPGFTPPQLQKYRHPPSNWQIQRGGKRKRKSYEYKIRRRG